MFADYCVYALVWISCNNLDKKDKVLLSSALFIDIFDSTYYYLYSY